MSDSPKSLPLEDQRVQDLRKAVKTYWEEPRWTISPTRQKVFQGCRHTAARDKFSPFYSSPELATLIAAAIAAAGGMR